MNGVAFLAYVEQVLVPTLVPGDQVIMDNLPAHKVSGDQTGNRGGGAIDDLLLPPYSPDFNPIEQAFAKLKATAQKGRSLEPSMTYGMPSPRSSNSSHQPNAPTSSLTQDMNQNDRKML